MIYTLYIITLFSESYSLLFYSFDHYFEFFKKGNIIRREVWSAIYFRICIVFIEPSKLFIIKCIKRQPLKGTS